ncbi:unnamed protein product [Ectocarpus sp. 4 AP-2014]
MGSARKQPARLPPGARPPRPCLPPVERYHVQSGGLEEAICSGPIRHTNGFGEVAFLPLPAGVCVEDSDSSVVV